MSVLTISRKGLVLVYSLSAIVSLAGVYFAYHTQVTSSVVWIKWGNNQAWVGDSIRLVVLYGLALLLVTTSFRAGRDKLDSSYTIRLGWKNSIAVIVFVATVLVLNFYYYPIYFEQDLLRNAYGLLTPDDLARVRTAYFDEVYKPFFSYAFYAFPLWIFIILPTFLVFLDGFIADHRLAKERIDALARTRPSVDIAEHWEHGPSKEGLNEVLSDVDDRNAGCILALRILVQRYLPVLLVVVIGYVAFNVLLSDKVIGDHKTLAPSQTSEARSSFSWIILIFVAIYGVFFVKFANLFADYRYAMDDAIRDIDNFVRSHELSYHYKENVKLWSTKWDTRRKNALLFLKDTLVDSGSVHLPLLILIAVSIFSVAIQDFADELIPISIREFIDNYLLRDKPTP